jgi:hypothetical protein
MLHRAVYATWVGTMTVLSLGGSSQKRDVDRQGTQTQTQGLTAEVTRLDQTTSVLHKPPFATSTLVGPVDAVAVCECDNHVKASSRLGASPRRLYYH